MHESLELKDSGKFINVLMYATICVIYAFSNIKILSMGMQLAFVIAILISILHKKKVRLTTHFYWMSAFILWGLFVSMFAVSINDSMNDIVNMILKLLFYTSLIMYVKSERNFHSVLRAIVFAGFVLALRLVITTPGSAWGSERLGKSIDLNANAIGMAFSYASISAMYLAKKIYNPRYYILIVPFISISLLTGSRKAFFIITGGMSLWLLLSIKERRNIILPIFLSLLFIWVLYEASMNIPIFYRVLGNRLENLKFITSATGLDASALTRKMMIEEGWTLFKQRPIIGFGLENYKIISSFGTYSHNNYMELLTSTGIIGTLIYYFLPIKILLTSLVEWKNKNKKYNIIITFMTVILVMDFALVSYKQLITQVMLTISASYFFVLSKKIKNKVGFTDRKANDIFEVESERNEEREL